VKRLFALSVAIILVLLSVWGCSPDRIASNGSIGDVASGGSSRWEFLSPLDPIFYGVDTFIGDIVGRETLIAWIEQFQSPGKLKGRDMMELTIVNAVKELKVPREDFIRANKDITYTDEQIEAIYSGDVGKTNRAFVSRYAFLHGDKVYTADWLASRSAKHYQREGISEEALMAYLARIDIEEFKDEVLAIRGALHKARGVNSVSGQAQLSRTEALAPYSIEYYGLDSFLINGLLEEDSLNRWLDQFVIRLNKGKRATSSCTVANLVKELGIPKQLFDRANAEAGTVYSPAQVDAIYAGDDALLNRNFVNRYALLVTDRIYPAEWFYPRDISDYKKAGITVEMLEEYLKKIAGVQVLQREYEWLLSAVVKMKQ